MTEETPRVFEKEQWLYLGYYCRDKELLFRVTKVSFDRGHWTRSDEIIIFAYTRKFNLPGVPGNIYTIDTCRESEGVIRMKAKGAVYADYWPDTKEREQINLDSKMYKMEYESYGQELKAKKELDEIKLSLAHVRRHYNNIGTTRGRIIFEALIIEAIRGG